MRYRSLGNTGLKVSEITLGTVELGMDYGFKGGAHFAKPDRADCVRVVLRALERGINCIDTARAYGEAESVVGQALRQAGERPVVCTKLALTGDTRPADVHASIDASLRELGLAEVDVLQIHSATAASLANEDAIGALMDAQRSGKARFVAASVYTEAEALAAADRGWLRSIQVPFNMLDQTMADRVLPAAAAAGSGVLVRSAFLRGVLTPNLDATPAPLAPLRDAARRALAIHGAGVDGLASLALRFCLSFPAVSSVIVGVRSTAEVDANVDAAEAGPWPAETLARRGEFAVREAIASPANWTGLI